MIPATKVLNIRNQKKLIKDR